MASRIVASPQIRVRGTVGGNLGSASSAGDEAARHVPLEQLALVLETAQEVWGYA